MSFKLPPTQHQLDQAAALFQDGASQREVQRSTGIARETLRKTFPGNGWTFKEGGDFRALERAAEPKLRRLAA